MCIEGAFEIFVSIFYMIVFVFNKCLLASHSLTLSLSSHYLFLSIGERLSISLVFFGLVYNSVLLDPHLHRIYVVGIPTLPYMLPLWIPTSFIIFLIPRCLTCLAHIHPFHYLPHVYLPSTTSTLMSSTTQVARRSCKRGI